MPKGVAKDAFANSGTANNLAGKLNANAANVYGGLEPTLQAEAAHPQGLTPQAKAAMNTAAQQSAGGGTAGAIGAGRLYASRTRNSGGAKAAIGEAVRGAGKNLSDAALNTEITNAKMQQQNQQGGLAGLSRLEAGQQEAGENAMGLSDKALGLAEQADQNNPWMKVLLQGMQGAGDIAAARAGRS